MEVNVKALHFAASKQLEDFIEKKISKLNHYFDAIISCEVILKVEKPEAAKNKNATVRLTVSSGELFADKTADTFEEAIDQCSSALEKQLVKFKKKNRTKEKYIPNILSDQK